MWTTFIYFFPPFILVFHSQQDFFEPVFDVDGCLCFGLRFLSEPGPRGLGEDEGLLDHRGGELLPQQLHLHLLAHRAQLQGQVAERQALLAAVAVGSGRGVSHHLRRKRSSAYWTSNKKN